MASANGLSLSEVVERELADPNALGPADAGILQELAKHGFSEAELFDLIVPRRTLARRRQTGGKLSPEESDRAVRVARLTAMAERIFGDEGKAYRWLRKPSRTLAGAVPLSLMKSESGAHLVEQTLHRIDYGMLA